MCCADAMGVCVWMRAEQRRFGRAFERAQLHTTARRLRRTAGNCCSLLLRSASALFHPSLICMVCVQLDEEGDATIDAHSALKNDRRFTWRLLRLFQREQLIK
jgi:hypothetical protein